MDDNTHSFIVRIWQEKSDENSLEAVIDPQLTQKNWRGWIEAVGSGHRLYFQDLQSALRFIQESAGIAKPAKNSWLRKIIRRLQHD